MTEPPLPVLDAERLQALLAGPGARWRSVEVVPETGSTNADLAVAARAGVGVDRALLTGSQTAGRGRLGRTWTAPPGASLACSVLVRPALPPSRWSWLPLLAGVAVVDAVATSTGVEAVLKWPNDVLVGTGKLCGILAERVETPDGPAVVLGLGLNVALTAEQLPVPTATSLLLEGVADPDPTVVAAALLTALARWLTVAEAAPDELRAAYTECCATLGRSVRVELGADRTVTGVAESVDLDGRLVVRTDAGPQAFSAGDVVHLR